MKEGVRYRVGDLMKVEGDLVEVQFGNSTEVLPMNCVAVARVLIDATVKGETGDDTADRTGREAA
jgi:hypothetical protein